MTDVTPQRIYRSRTGRILTDADIERIAEEVATTDCDVEQVRTRIKQAGT